MSVVAISVIKAFGKSQEEAKLAPVTPTKAAEPVKTHRDPDVSVKPFEFKPRQVTGQEIITGICALDLSEI